MGDVGAGDVTENSSPKVEQLVITPFDEGKAHVKVYCKHTVASFFWT